VLLPRAEPPPGYVAFVARSLDELRRDADDRYGDVLTDVAVRWAWVQLLVRVGWRNAPDACLRRSVRRSVRRSRRPGSESEPVAELSEVDIRVLPTSGPRALSPPPVRSSAATRLAGQLRPDAGSAGGPAASPGAEAAAEAAAAEAAVAWWHAYEAYRRWLLVAGLALVVVYFVVVVLQDLQHA
jgi:hypothetical protein